MCCRQGLEEVEVRSWQPEQRSAVECVLSASSRPLFLKGFALAGKYYANWFSVGLQVAGNQLWLIGPMGN